MSAEREPIFNAPWPAVALTAVLLGSYGLQTLVGLDALINVYAFLPQDLRTGRWETLFTALFLHGGWAHVLMNAAGALAFGTPVARFMGTGARGASVFFIYYMACGALASLGYGLLHPEANVAIIGASGAVSGLMASAARMIAGQGVPGPFRSPAVIGMSIAWLVVNLLLAVVGFAPGMGEAKIAWEAHLIGFAAGLVLLDPFAWLARGHPDRDLGEH